jgi:hypothetical protein
MRVLKNKGNWRYKTSSGKTHSQKRDGRKGEGDQCCCSFGMIPSIFAAFSTTSGTSPPVETDCWGFEANSPQQFYHAFQVEYDRSQKGLHRKANLA